MSIIKSPIKKTTLLGGFLYGNFYEVYRISVLYWYHYTSLYGRQEVFCQAFFQKSVNRVPPHLISRQSIFIFPIFEDKRRWNAF